MSNREESSEQQAPRERRPYEPPRVLETAVFETLALGCSKTPGASFQCTVVNPQDS